MTDREKLIELVKGVPYGVSVGAKFTQEFSEKVADHLLTNGVIVPPCKVGDKVYWLGMFNQLVEGEVVNTGAYIGAKTAKVDYVYDILYDDIGKTVFLSREQAEKALKGVE